MCGIVGYVGFRQAHPLLMEGLRKVKYRGYDSIGRALIEDGELVIHKCVGNVEALENLLTGQVFNATIGIGHTRWATHGEVNVLNTHPHSCSKNGIALVHNGIIENYRFIKEFLLSQGYVFESETDTEALLQLICYHYHGDLFEAVRSALLEVEGTYGIAVICRHHPNQIVVACHGSSLVIGCGDNEHFIGSDAKSFDGNIRRIIYLEDKQIAVITPTSHDLFTLENHHVPVKVEDVSAGDRFHGKGNYPHYMLTEIFEQPGALVEAARGRFVPGATQIHLRCLEDGFGHMVKRIDYIKILACGTSYHSGQIAAMIMEKILKVPVSCEQASEFRYRDPHIPPNSLCIGISQSGETADTLAGLKVAKERGAYCLGIVNVVGSQIARLVDSGIYLHAGPEISVASTKAFTSQVMTLSILNLGLAKFMDLYQPLTNGSPRISDDDFIKITNEIISLPGKVKNILANVYDSNGKTGIVQEIAREFYTSPYFLFLGRGYNYATAFEGALKLKEVSAIPAEGYSAAEMKHGPIALIGKKTPVVVIAPQDVENHITYEKIVNNAEQVNSRHGRIIAVISEGDTKISRMAEHSICIPKTVGHLTPILAIVPLQLIAYEIAVLLGLNPDEPRNLAKSVTVE